MFLRLTCCQNRLQYADMCAFVVLSIISMTVGLETGIGLPVSGLYRDVSSAQSLNLFFSRSLGKCSVELAGGIQNYRGEYDRYSLEDYTAFAGLSCRAKPVTFIARLGSSFVRRSLAETEEKGWAMSYELGVGLPVRFEKLEIGPVVTYRGLNDISGSAGLLYLTLRFGYVL